jgi:hypothetical protein
MENKTTAKKPSTKKAKKPIKETLSEELYAMAARLDKAIMDGRGGELNTSACARLGKVSQTLKFVAKNISR